MPRSPRLLVVDPSIAYPEERGAAEVIGDWPGEVTVLKPALSPGDGPGRGSPYDFDGVILLGSRASVNDSYPWLEELGGWLDPILDGRRPVPLFGICFGHQLVAHLAGGSVGFVHEDRRAELGVRESLFEASRLVPEIVSMPVVVSHREEVKRVPAGYRVVSRRDGIPVDGLEHESLPVFSFQFHPEAREEFLTRRGADASGVDPRLVEANRSLLAAFRRFALDASQGT